MESRRQKLIGKSPYWKESQIHFGRQYKSPGVSFDVSSFGNSGLLVATPVSRQCDQIR
jgi:hypothetical protein